MSFFLLNIYMMTNIALTIMVYEINLFNFKIRELHATDV